MEHRRYTRQEKARYEKGQTILTPTGAAPNPNAYCSVTTTTVLPLEKNVSCPFCLGLSEFRKFLISTKKGISSKMGKCPLCGQGMFLKTLKMMSECTAKRYAEWVWPYSGEGFWKKVQFSTWKNRLRLMGWTEEFWDRYKELKHEAHMDEAEEGGGESFMEYVQRKAQEEADERRRQEEGVSG